MDDHLNETLLYKLALGLIASSEELRSENPRLLVGEVADDLAFVPLPEDVVLLGSLKRNKDLTRSMFESKQSPEAIFAFYKACLPGLGWSLTPETPSYRIEQGGGFVHTGFIRSDKPQALIFCQGPNSPVLRIFPFPAAEGHTLVRVTIERNAKNSPCTPQLPRKRQRTFGQDFYPLPTLQPPDGAEQHSGGGGSSDRSVNTSAGLKVQVETALETLLVHYVRQFEQAGWSVFEQGQEKSLGWFKLSFTDEENEPWRGAFYILKIPTEQRMYSLHVKAEWLRNPDTANWRW